MTGAEDDDDLVRRTLDGDLAAFEGLVARHSAVVHRVVARIAGREAAEDVAQEAFLRAFHRLGQYRGGGAFRGWLLRIAHNTALSALERRRDTPAGPDAMAEALERDDGGGGRGPRTPVEALEQRERLDRLEAKLRLLRDEHRTVLVLRDVEGLSYDEVAAVADVPLGSVKGRLHRARLELIDLLRHNTYDWELPG
jgi:RNA polymerase sigma-70 factor, ECF subfamily